MLKTAVDTNINLKVANVYKPLWKNAKRRNYIYGGRGSGKSHDVAEYCLFRAYQSKIKVLCTRELQNSIADSVYSLLKNKITDMHLDFFFTVYKDRIVGNNGSEFIFKGIHNNVSEIKSMENISIAWLEESQSLSRESIDVIVPTIRAPGSILIFTFNPYKDNDPIYMEMKNATEDDLVIKANYSDNPWFPEELRLEMERDKKNDYQKYLWVWEGECLGLSDAQIFRGKYVVENFETPKNADFHFGADWGFANDPTTLVRSFIVGNDLYIDMCAGKVGCDLEDTPSLFNEVQGSSIYPIYADSARPETISFMRSKHYNVIAAEKWNGSVEDGIQYLRSFSCIHIHERCKAVAEEFDLYQYKVDRQTGEVLRIPVDKFNHYIDAIRYSLTVPMRSANNGKVYDNFRVENICKDEKASGDVYLGTFALPGRILWVSACVISGEIKILDAFSQSVIDFKAVKDKYPDCNLVWMPYTTLKDIQQNYVDDCVDNDIEPAVPGILPAEGEGTKLVNDLFDRHSLSIMESAWTLISCLNERVFLADGKIERSGKEQENTRYCRLFEYLVWRIMGRLQNE
jgi:phage terminase large subunit